MTKAAFFVAIYSIALLILFGVFCFLMTTVNPPPVVKSTGNLRKKETGLEYQSSFYLRNMDSSDESEYGLEKAFNFQEYQSSSINPLYLNNITMLLSNPNITEFHPLLWHLNVTAKSDIVSSKNTQNTEATTITNTSEITQSLTATRTDSILVTDGSIINETTIIPETKIKGHRRSVNAIEKKKNGKDGSVILKILDDSGKPRIEIKLRPNDMFEKYISRIHGSSLKTDTKFSMVIEGKDKGLDINELPDQTEIKILPNDTVIVAHEVHDLGNREIDSNIAIDKVSPKNNMSKVIPEKIHKYLSNTTQTTKQKSDTDEVNTEYFNSTSTLFGLKFMLGTESYFNIFLENITKS